MRWELKRRSAECADGIRLLRGSVCYPEFSVYTAFDGEIGKNVPADPHFAKINSFYERLAEAFLGYLRSEAARLDAKYAAADPRVRRAMRMRPVEGAMSSEIEVSPIGETPLPICETPLPICETPLSVCETSASPSGGDGGLVRVTLTFAFAGRRETRETVWDAGRGVMVREKKRKRLKNGAGHGIIEEKSKGRDAK